jgi:transposase-like protein
MRPELTGDAIRRPLPPAPATGPANGGFGIESLSEILPDGVQRWTARRRAALVLAILKGELSVEEGAQRHGLTVGEIEGWKERLLVAAHNALRSKPRDEEALREEQIRRLTQKVGELVLEVDMLREALRNARSGGAEEAED